ncbi:MAG TPA: UrcA family protein [Allosphingosinicella sp.]|nr:UrcA family protein [Allosphingosinicella sp.]
MKQQKALLILLALSSASPAIAQAQPAPKADKLPHVDVRYKDLDLSAAAGMRALELAPSALESG